MTEEYWKQLYKRFMKNITYEQSFDLAEKEYQDKLDKGPEENG